MANRPNNIWAKAAAGSPGTNIARAQQSRWTGIPNEAIMRLVEDKIGGMLEGISDATERNAAAQMQLDLQKKLQAAAAGDHHDFEMGPARRLDSHQDRRDDDTQVLALFRGPQPGMRCAAMRRARWMQCTASGMYNTTR